MNSSGIVLTFDNLTGENIGTIWVLIIVLQFFSIQICIWKLELLSVECFPLR